MLMLFKSNTYVVCFCPELWTFGTCILWLLFLQPFKIQVPEQPHEDAMEDILGSCILLQFEGG
jgi:hypothetical protein